MSEKETKTIVERLAAVAADLGTIEKRFVDQKGAGQFYAFAIDDLYANLRPLFTKHGVVVVPHVESVEYGTTERGRITSGVEVAYQFYGLAGDKVVMRSAGAGHDGGDKATNKALQMAFKYGLIQMFLISTGEVDPDAAPDPTADQKPERTPAAKAARPSPEDYHAERVKAVKDHAWQATAGISDEADRITEAQALVEQAFGWNEGEPKNKKDVAAIVEYIDSMGNGS